MTPPTSSTTEPPVFELGTLEIPPAAGLEQNEVLPFSIANFKKAVADHLRAHDGDDTQLWIVFSGFDCSKLKYIDQLRLPVRLQVDNSTLIVKMVGSVHELMHRGLSIIIQRDMALMGLLGNIDFFDVGSTRYEHRSGNSSKEADSALAPIGPQPWPAIVIEAGWAETLARLHIDAQWWLSAQLPPNNTTLVVLVSFRRPERTFRLEKYELVAAPGRVVTRSGVRNLAMCTGFATIDLRSTPPIITGAPFVLPFAGIMRRPPIAPQRNVSMSAAELETWATGIARAWNL
jgi:hypothetical protein